jgi:type II secretory pathway pseudopilin PulG
MTRKDDAFTLLEALVAFAILSLFLTITLGGLSQVLLRDRQSDLTSRALHIAQTKLDELGTIEPLAAGSRHGETPEDFAWSEDIRPASSTPAIPGYWVEVRVAVPGTATRERRTIALTTFKIGPARR